LAAEVCERLEQDLVENQRRATLLTIAYHYYQNKRIVSQTRSLALNSYKPEKMASQCVGVITKSTQCPVAYMGISASKFIPSKESHNFLKFFKNTNATSKNDEMNSETCKLADTVDSSKNITNSESNSEVTETNIPVIISEKDSSLRTEEQKSAEIKDSPTIKKSVTIGSERKEKNKRIVDNLLNTSTENSPTSKKVFKLMEVCNERVKTKSKNKRLSGLVIDNHDFQDSFFMNVYKTGKKRCSSNIDTMEEPECVIQSIKSSTNEESANDGNIDDDNSNLYIQRNAKSSTSCASIHVNGNNESAKKNNETFAREPAVRLREIFPNLDDIDTEILSLLPADLQEEAKSYMKSRNKKQESVKIVREGKTGKGKSNKSKVAGKSGKRRSPLYNFLIKTDSDEHDVPLERCAECNQMIAMTKFSEHMDFHVAQNLYQEINKPVSSEKKKFEDVEVTS
jgi:hypothetical protein